MDNLPVKIDLQIVTPERLILKESTDEVVIPGSLGYLGVLPGHIPLLTSLKIGEIKYRKGNKYSYIAVSWGFAEILPDRVTILAELAEAAEDIDIERAKVSMEKASQQIQSKNGDLLSAQVSLEKALTRLQVASRRES